MHGSNALQRQIVVHHGEHALLHLTAVPGVDNNLLTGGDVEDYGCLGVQPELFIVGNLSLGSVVNNEIRLEGLQLFIGRFDEHVAYEVCLPCDLHDETDGHAGILVSSAVSINNEQSLVGELLLCDVLYCFPCFLGSRMVIILVLIGSPPYGVL